MLKKQEVCVVYAEVINKNAMDYFAIPGRIPSPTDLFEVTFKLEDGSQIIFEVSVYEYNVIEIGDEGILKYQGSKIISFGDKIKEFMM